MQPIKLHLVNIGYAYPNHMKLQPLSLFLSFNLFSIIFLSIFILYLYQIKVSTMSSYMHVHWRQSKRQIKVVATSYQSLFEMLGKLLIQILQLFFSYTTLKLGQVDKWGLQYNLKPTFNLKRIILTSLKIANSHPFSFLNCVLLSSLVEIAEVFISILLLVG